MLRVLADGEYYRVGGHTPIKANVRIIAATHRDLLTHAKEGHFREDLYYRLNVFPIEIPPLRARGNDIALIAQEMIDQFSNKMNRPAYDLGDEEIAQLRGYSWPGNVRELQNLIERAVIISNNEKIDWSLIIPTGDQQISVEQPSEDVVLTAEQLINLERENILKALKKTRWRISGPKGAANLLQLPPTTLTSKIKALGIERPI